MMVGVLGKEPMTPRVNMLRDDVLLHGQQNLCLAPSAMSTRFKEDIFLANLSLRM